MSTLTYKRILLGLVLWAILVFSISRGIENSTSYQKKIDAFKQDLVNQDLIRLGTQKNAKTVTPFRRYQWFRESKTKITFFYDRDAKLTRLNTPPNTWSVGIGKDDSDTETVTFVPVMHSEYYFEGNILYTYQERKTFGETVYDIYRSRSDYSLVFVARDGVRGIVITVPDPLFRKAKKPKYIDLAQTKF